MIFAKYSDISMAFSIEMKVKHHVETCAKRHYEGQIDSICINSLLKIILRRMIGENWQCENKGKKKSEMSTCAIFRLLS